MKPAFPRSTAWWWFGCKSAPKETIGNEITKDDLVYDGDNVAERDQHVQHHDVASSFDVESGETDTTS